MGWDSTPFGNQTAGSTPTQYSDVVAGAKPSMSYSDWMAGQQQAQQQAGGDGGIVINPDDYANQVSYNLPGYGDGWQWDVAHNQYIKVDPNKSTPGENNHVTVLHDNGNGGIDSNEQNWDIRPNKFEHILGDYIMPLAVGAITAGAGAAAIGGYMAAGAGAAGAAGEGAAATGAVGTASEAAPAFTYGASAPGWSQAAGTELGTGFYGTSNADMAALFGTTADSGAGLGSGIGTGVAADGGAWAGAGGGWPGLMAEAGAGSTGTLQQAYDLYKKANNAYKLYNTVTGGSPATGTANGPTSGLNGVVGTVGSGALSQALAQSGIVPTNAPGTAKLTDLTSEIQQIPFSQSPIRALPLNNNLPSGKNNAMLNGYGLWKSQNP